MYEDNKLATELKREFAWLNMTAYEFESFMERYCIAGKNQAVKQIMEMRLNSKREV